MTVTIRPAAPETWDALHTLLGDAGLPPDGLDAHLATTIAAWSGDTLVGAAGLEVYGREALLRSVAVALAHRGTGLGSRLTEEMLRRAEATGVTRVWLLTETAERFFPRFGFRLVERAQVPDAVKQSAEFQGACPDTAIVMVRECP